MPSGFFWGGLTNALGQGGYNAANLLLQQQKLKQEQQTNTLKNKMLQFQLDQAIQQEAHRQAVFNDMATQVPMGGPVNGPATESGQMPEQPPAQYRSKSVSELRNDPQFLGHLMQSQPKEFTTQFMRNMFPTNAGLHGGFDTIQEAQAAAGGQPVRFRQLGTGKYVIEQIAPVNAMADVYHSSKAEAKGLGMSDTAAEEYALGRQRAAQYGQGAAQGAGHAEGTAAQTLGAPMNPMVPYGGAGAPPTFAPPQAASNPLGTAPQANQAAPRPTPAGGPTQTQGQGQSNALRAKQAESEATAQGKLDVESSPQNVQTQGRISAQKAAGTHAGQAETGLAAATAALKNFDKVSEEMKGTTSSFLGAAAAQAGAHQGILGRAARSAGAPDVAARMQAAQLPVIQHYESMYAGVRGAASPVILEMLSSKMIQPTDEPSMIDAKKAYFHNVFNALSDSIKRQAAGLPIGEDLEKTIMSGATPTTAPSTGKLRFNPQTGKIE